MDGEENKRLLSGRHRWLLALLVAFMALVGGAGVSAIVLQRSLYTPRHHWHGDRIVTVHRGTTAKQVWIQLKQQSILPDSFVLRLWFNLKSSTNTLKAGDYLFESPITPARVLEKLIRGEVHRELITFPEGLTRFEVAHLIQTLSIKEAEKSLELTEDSGLLRFIRDVDPEATTLEGYLFPDTYQYISTTTASQLMAAMIRRFREVFTPAYRQRTEELRLSVRQIVTLASLIELEARLDEERPLISSVFHNRLRLGMKLDCDPTVVYASILAGRWTGTIRQSDLQRNSPYNTYLSTGLPPGPIASPGRASIEAALYPTQTDHLYFVVDATREDGAHRFSAKLRQHQSNVALYRLAQRQRNKPEK
jgi:UPF0755 protein